MKRHCKLNGHAVDNIYDDDDHYNVMIFRENFLIIEFIPLSLSLGRLLLTKSVFTRRNQKILDFQQEINFTFSVGFVRLIDGWVQKQCVSSYFIRFGNPFSLKLYKCAIVVVVVVFSSASFTHCIVTLTDHRPPKLQTPLNHYGCIIDVTLHSHSARMLHEKRKKEPTSSVFFVVLFFPSSNSINFRHRIV